MPFGQHQDTELWNNQFPEIKILGPPASRRMRGLVYMASMASRDKVDYGKPIAAIFNNLIYIQFSIYIYVILFCLFNLIFIFMQYF